MRENYDRRIGTRVPAHEAVVELLDFRPRVRDISQTGAFIEDPRPLPAGRMLRILFRLTPDSPAITVWAMVRRPEEGKGMGVEFVQISAKDRALLRNFLQERALGGPETEADLEL